MDELTRLINKYKNLKETIRTTQYEIEKTRNEIKDILSKSKEKLIIKCSHEKEANICDLDYDWTINELVNKNKSLKEILLKDIENNISCYVKWSDVTINIEDENGNVLESFS